MKFITWNCQGAYRKKAAVIAQSRPDIAVIQECEAPEKLLFQKNVPLPSSQLWVGDGTNKGIGIFSYTNLNLQLCAHHLPSIKYCIPVRVSGRFNFNLMAIWAMGHRDRKLSYIGQVFLAINHYRDFIRERDTVLIGDFNSNKRWDNMPRVGNHSAVVEALGVENIYSVYHEYFKEQQGEETRNTFFMYRKLTRGFHIDYCFAPRSWIHQLKAVSLGSYEEWGKLSDHSPLFVEFY
jgi:exonuclease III